MWAGIVGRNPSIQPSEKTKQKIKRQKIKKTRGANRTKIKPPDEKKQNRQAVKKKHVTLTGPFKKKNRIPSDRWKKQEKKQDGLRLTARKNRILAGERSMSNKIQL